MLPISLPHENFVKRGRKCQFSWVIGLILLLWVLATAAIVFHLAPDCVYRKIHQWTHHAEPRLHTAERYVIDIAEPHFRVPTRLPHISDVPDDSAVLQEMRKRPMSIIDESSRDTMRDNTNIHQLQKPVQMELMQNRLLVEGDVRRPFGQQMTVDGESQVVRPHMTVDGDTEVVVQQQQVNGNAHDDSAAVIDGEAKEIHRDDAVVDGSASFPSVTVDGSVEPEKSSDSVPNEDDATDAIRTLLKRPDVQQVVIVGRNEDSSSDQKPKGVIVIDGSGVGENGDKQADVLSQLRNTHGVLIPAEQLMGDTEQPIQSMPLAAPPAPQATEPQQEQPAPEPHVEETPQLPPQQTPEFQQQQEIAKYHHALMMWQMQREMFRRQMLMRMERERAMASAAAAAREMPHFLMGVPPFQQQRQRMMMMYRMPVFHMMFPPQQQQVPQQMIQPQNIPEIERLQPETPESQIPVHEQPPRQDFVIPQREVIAPQQQEIPQQEVPVPSEAIPQQEVPVAQVVPIPQEAPAVPQETPVPQQEVPVVSQEVQTPQVIPQQEVQTPQVIPQQEVQTPQVIPQQEVPVAPQEVQVPQQEVQIPEVIPQQEVPTPEQEVTPLQEPATEEGAVLQQEVTDLPEISQDSTELPMVRPHDASADQIVAAMQADPSVDRDAIFRRLLAQSQVETDKEEPTIASIVEPSAELNDEIYREMMRAAQEMTEQQEKSKEESEQKEEKTHDEIFHELQQKSLELRREADARAVLQAIDPVQDEEHSSEETVTAEAPVVMVADTFPRRSTIAEPEQQATSPIPFNEGEAIISNQNTQTTPQPQPLADFFRFFENEATRTNKENHPEVQDITAVNFDARTEAPQTVIDNGDQSGMEVDQPEPAEGTSPIEAEIFAVTDDTAKDTSSE